MSYSNRNDYIKNPASMFVEWNGDEGYFYFYSKEDKQRFKLEEIRFVVLDQLNTIRGFNEKTDAGIFANEVRNLGKDNLLVKTTKGEHIASGIYGTIKDTITAKGGKFCKAVYALSFNEDQTSFDLISLQLVASSFSSWIDTLKDVKSLYDTVFVWSGGSTDHQKGKIKYKKPIFVIDDISEISTAIHDNAQKYDEILQEYFKSKNGSAPVVAEEVITDEKIVESEKKEITSDEAIQAFEDDIPAEFRDDLEPILE